MCTCARSWRRKPNWRRLASRCGSATDERGWGSSWTVNNWMLSTPCPSIISTLILPPTLVTKVSSLLLILVQICLRSGLSIMLVLLYSYIPIYTDLCFSNLKCRSVCSSTQIHNPIPTTVLHYLHITFLGHIADVCDWRNMEGLEFGLNSSSKFCICSVFTIMVTIDRTTSELLV